MLFRLEELVSAGIRNLIGGQKLHHVYNLTQ